MKPDTSAPKATNTAVGYVRVSLEEMAERGVSLAVQRDRLAEYGRRHCIEFIDIVADEGVSAAIPLAERPGGRRLLEMIAGRRPAVRTVAAVRLDRLFRSLADGAGTLDLWSRRGVGAHIVEFGGEPLDTHSATGSLRVGIMLTVGEWERRTIGERTALAMAQLRRQGRAYSPTPLGYDEFVVGEGDRARKHLLPNEAEQGLIARIHGMRREGKAYAAIARTLNEEGVTGKKGGRLYASTIRYIIRHSVHAEP